MKLNLNVKTTFFWFEIPCVDFVRIMWIFDQSLGVFSKSSQFPYFSRYLKNLQAFVFKRLMIDKENYHIIHKVDLDE